MHEDYYINTVYPLQDKVLKLFKDIPVDFYLTGGTVLSRVFLHHRYSDDLDFFVNAARNFKEQVNEIVKSLKLSGFLFETGVIDEDFARLIIREGENSLKIDLVNDIPFYCGERILTALFIRTDNVLNILSNKITALGRYSPKDVADIVFICRIFTFSWEKILNDAFEKDMWVNPIQVADVLENFPSEKLDEIIWIGEPPDKVVFTNDLNQIIRDIVTGADNSLVKRK